MWPGAIWNLKRKPLRIKGDGQGLYVAWSNLEFEAEAAPYSMAVNDAGQAVLTLTADDGTINWVRQAE